ncbi:MAG: hypothetical protein U1E41_14240 [Paracoccus sp. (in: a-proteobacteria)]
MNVTKLETMDMVDRAIETINGRGASAFLFGFSVTILEKVSRDILEKYYNIDRSDFSSIQEGLKRIPPALAFPNSERSAGLVRDLISNIYQAINGNENTDDIAELIAWIGAAMEREGYSSQVIHDVFLDAITRGLECAMKLS